MNIYVNDAEYIAGTYARFPLHIVSGKGALVYDETGREYIDLQSGIAVNTFGTADDEWIKAVTDQLKLCQHTSNLFFSDPCVLLAKKLCGITGMKKVFFGNSGAEANECAIKTARKYASDKYGAGRHKIITLENSFHGRTITTLAATGQAVFHKDFTPLTDGFTYAVPGDITTVEEMMKSGETAAVMFELIQGEGGVLPLEHEFVKALAGLAAKYDVLLIADEVQTGNGRTGKYFAYMNYGIAPDIVTTAKGLGGGLPIGAAILGDKVKNTLTSGSHGSTFGGNPAICAGALNIVSRINDELLSGVKRKSEIIIDKLENADGVKSITGMGLMLGIETQREAADVINECRENGVLVIKAKNKVRLLPPLNIPDDLLTKAVDIIARACAKQ